jgi:outer membrane immunogenic protein
MKKYLLSSVALTTVLGGSAFAADMPVKAPPLPTCYACNWTGFYFGVNAGGSIGHDPTTDTISMTAPGSPNGLGGVPPGVLNPISNTTYNQSPAGGLGGFQAGVNWQSGHAVLGAEVDWDWTNQRDNLQVTNFIASSTTVARNTSYGYSDQEKIKWLATARARLGWASGYSMAYVTGGVAWGGIDSNYAFQGLGSNLFATAPGGASFSTTKTGWVIGSGVETSLAWMGANHWSAKLEYLYVDLGTVTNSFFVPLTATPANGYAASNSTHIRDNIVRAGLNYRFAGDRGTTPVPGPCPTCNWTGFYLGANVGSSIGRDRAHETVALNPPGGGAGVVNPLTDVWHTESPVGALGGFQGGFNWQTNNVVLGVEADWDWSGQRDSFNNSNFIASTVNVAPSTIGLTDNQKLDWLATARGRLGWTENCFLWYVTGGVAWGRAESSYAFQVNQVPGIGSVTFPAGPFAASTSATQTGWTIGGGVETKMTWLGLSDRWSGKFEYLYVDLGSITNTFSIPVTGAVGAYTFSSTSQIRDNIVRFGVNYRLGG